MDWLGDHAWEAWLGLTVLLGVTELIGMDLILLMLAAGAFVGFVAAIIGLPAAAQVLVAAGGAVALLALLRPNLIKRLHGGPELRLGHGKLVGEQALVTQEVSTLNPGRVRLGGEIWSAQPYDETMTIAQGEHVEVFEIRGATAFVHPIASLGP